MSRLIKKPIKLLPGVTVVPGPDSISFKGPQGERKVALPNGLGMRVEGENIWLQKSPELDPKSPIYGTTWALLKNAAEGIANGFSKSLEIEGVGYRASLEGGELVLFLGYAHPVRFRIPDGVSITVEKNLIKISGIDKDLVGRVASDIRALKKPEPYKGKGIRYHGEIVRRKVGKKAGATTTT